MSGSRMNQKNAKKKTGGGEKDWTRKPAGKNRRKKKARKRKWRGKLFLLLSSPGWIRTNATRLRV